MSQEIQNIDSIFLNELKNNSGLTVALGVVVLLMGMFAMASPFIVGITLAIAVGFLLIISGLGQLVFALKARAGFFSIILAVLTIIAGGYMVSNLGIALATMTIVLAIYFIISGVFEVMMAYHIKPVRGWSWALFSGVISILLGAIIWIQFPVSGIWAIGMLIGIKLVFSGWTLLMFGLIARSIVKELA